MKAIVQTCDRYHSICEHMLTKYFMLWNSNKFTFRVPWNKKYPYKLAGKFGKRIELIHSEVEFKKTFEALTKDLPDEEWVYWCIDDKYPIELMEKKCNQVVDLVNKIEDKDIVNVTFNFVREVVSSSEEMKLHPKISYNNLTFIQHASFTNNWLHQFFRVSALREFWGNINEPDKYQAKAMDSEVKPISGKCFTLNHKISLYGESTDRGIITESCFNSCNNLKIGLPPHFKKEKKRGNFLI